MKKCEFSEMQFTVASLREIVNKLNPTKGWCNLIIPTQAAEKKLGYDCRIQGYTHVLFLQFKVPVTLKRKNAKWRSDYINEEPFYQIGLWPESETPQHNKLVELANSDPANKVFYCSPGFIEQTAFNEYYCKDEIMKNSMMIPCKNLGKISGNEKHVITYQLKPCRKYHMHSEVQEGIILEFDEQINMLKNSVPYPSVHDFINSISEYFKIQLERNVDDQINLRKVSHELLIKHNLHLVLF